ncbi:MAG: hypothetical protein J6Y02_11695 [Pseudobutyrivibrio sp.]|nr:hypothetical protein [Pseudobutyrivibrio sp.]
MDNEYLGEVIEDVDDDLQELEYILAHTGTDQPYDFAPFGSGRYRQGSGDNPYQRDVSLLARNAILAKQKDKNGNKLYTPKEIANALGYDSVNKYRADISGARHRKDAYEAHWIINLKNNGNSNTRIAEIVYGNPKKESHVRDVLQPYYLDKANTNERVKQVLRDNVEKKKYVDVGHGVEKSINVSTEFTPLNGISKDKLKKCLTQLVSEEGYTIHNIDIQQVMTNHKTKVQVLAAPGVTKGEVWANRESIGTIGDYFIDGGLTRLNIQPPRSVDSSRLEIKYPSDGGKDADGTMYLRRGVEDLSLGKSNYAQVRIAVDGTHYLKGMAMYGPDSMFKPGVDIIFNTSKQDGTPLKTQNKNEESVLKPLKSDPDNPFGATIKYQIYHDDPNGEYVKVPDKNGFRYIKDDGSYKNEPHLSLGAVNIVNEEGTWDKWAKTISAQMLSKQPEKIIKPQLDLTYEEKEETFKEIMSIPQPEIRKSLLLDFADSCDSDATELQAAGFPGQSSHVILPVPNMPENEIYAPRYQNGQKVILIRYPHAGPFEIPELIVNNSRKEAKEILGDNPIDAVGINAKVAEKLSGADFDGDTVQVIPSDHIRFDVKDTLPGLKDFDPHEQYKYYKGMRVMKDSEKGMAMGKITNLINDMTIKGATLDEIARAVKHSMVIIDAPKHKLDYESSERDNKIEELRRIYQGKAKGGASTLLSLAGSPMYVDPREDYKDVPVLDAHGKQIMGTDRNGNPKPKTKRLFIDPETGEQLHTSKASKYKSWEATEYDSDGNPIRINTETGEKFSYTGQNLRELGIKSKLSKVTLYQKTRDPKTKEYYDEPEFFDKYGNKYTGPKDEIKEHEKKRSVQISKMQNELENGGDARNLSTGTLKEELYADYANKVHQLANRARLETLSIEDSKYNPQAAKVYKDAVDSLNTKLDRAIENSPRERQATIYANAEIEMIKRANPDITYEELKKKKGQALAAARSKFGAKKEQIVINDREWEAIMSGAVRKTKLKEIIENSDTDKLKKRAMPKDNTISAAKMQRIEDLQRKGWNTGQIAELLDLSTSAVIRAVRDLREGGN